MIVEKKIDIFLNEKDNLNEASLSRIWQHIEKGNSLGIVTACRAEYDNKENDKRNRKLQSEISAARFGYFPVKGTYIENYGSEEATKVKESSFFIISKEPDKLKDFLIKVGKKYEQDSVLFMDNSNEDKIAVLIGTSSTWPGLNKIYKLGKWHPNKAREFYSEMKRGNFVFEGIDFSIPTNLMARYIKKLEEEK